VSFICETLLNALIILRLRSIIILSLFPAYITYIFSSRNRSAILTDYYFFILIYILGRSACVLAEKRIRIVIIILKALFRILKSVIGLYAFRSV
jgi:hypothetical protein